jgi:hypothetical protein
MSMVYQIYRPRTAFVAVVILFSLSLVLMTASCSADKTKAKALINEYLVNQGATDVVIDIFHRGQTQRDKAYTSATVTYSFASSEGKPQKEYLGFVLNQSASGWRIERNSTYTTDDNVAEQIIEGSHK